MTVSQAIARTDAFKPNGFTNGTKTEWLNEAEGYIHTEVFLRDPAEFTPCAWPEDQNTELSVKPPHDKLYIAYLAAMTDFANGEYDRYANSVTLYNNYLAEFVSWFARNHRPGGTGRPPYYLTAYGIAVKHGYEGTEEQWLASLKGDKGDKGDTGETGEQGPQGPQGENGAQGPQGQQGIQGPQGEPGDDYILTEEDKQEIAGIAVQSAVRFDEPQSLTDAQKAQARQNIKAAAPDGYYGESGGVFQYSTNFIGKNAPQNAMNIVFRPTASNFSGQSWSADSIEKHAATIEKIKGKTLVFNQLVQNGNFASTSGWTTALNRGTLSASNNILTYTAAEIGSAFNHNRSVHLLSTTPIYGHSYLLLCDIYTSSSSCVFGLAGTYLSKAVVPNTWNTVGRIITPPELATSEVCFGADMRDEQIGATYKLKNCMTFDLTQMFGAGNEPATVEEFKAMFPLDYYEYNPGELVSFNGTGLKTVGFNQLYPDGHIDVLGGVTYKIEGAYTSLKDSAGNDVTVSNGEFTPSEDDVYTMVGGSCVHLKWSGLRDGETEEHWDRTLALPVSTYFQDGMKSAGTVYDELTKDKYIKRIGKVDLGTLDWNYAYDTRKFSASTAGYGVAGSTLNFVSDRFSYHADVWDDSVYGDMHLAIGGTGSIYLRDFAYTDAASFKAAMSGVYLYYELAEPVETPISSELNLTYRVDDYGTEMLLPQNDDEPVTAPMDADIVYQIDYEAQIRNSDSLNITKESMDRFIAANNASGLGTITQTWDPVNKRYNYTVTYTQEQLDAINSGATAEKIGEIATAIADFISHKGNTGNPHSVTATQVGADPSGTASGAVLAHNEAVQAHSALLAAKHIDNVTDEVWTFTLSDGSTVQKTVKVGS